jgi:hypothetical protein
MLPIVHGLEKQYQGRVDFIYLDERDSANAGAKARLSFNAVPYLVALKADGTILRKSNDMMDRPTLERWLVALTDSAGTARKGD